MANFASGNIFINEMLFEDDQPVEGHAHDFDHTTYVVRGGLRIEKLDADDNVLRAIEKWANRGHNWVLIEAGVRHRITPLVLKAQGGSLGHCIFSHRTPQGDIVQEYTGWEGAYL